MRVFDSLSLRNSSSHCFSNPDMPLLSIFQLSALTFTIAARVYPTSLSRLSLSLSPSSLFSLFHKHGISFFLSISFPPPKKNPFLSLHTFIFHSQSMQIEKDHNEAQDKWVAVSSAVSPPVSNIILPDLIDGKLYSSNTSLLPYSTLAAIHNGKISRLPVWHKPTVASDINNRHFIVKLM